MEPTDSELLARYRDGDIAALEDLVQRYRRPLFGFICNMTSNPGEAEDVFQEVWFKVLRKLTLYRERNFLGWLVRIAHNVVIDRSRKWKPDVSLDAEPEESRSMGEIVPSKDRGPAAQVQSLELGRRIADAVAGLPAEQKEVFLLRVETGLSFKEISAVQKVSINTALARMQYALGKLKAVLADDYRQLA